MVVLVILRNSSKERLYVQNFLLNGNVAFNGNIAFNEMASTTVDPKTDAGSISDLLPVIVKAKEGEEPPTSCTCKTAPLFRPEVYQEQLSNPVSWLNMSSLEVLMKHHPNFPYSMIVNTNKEFCELLPSLHT